MTQAATKHGHDSSSRKRRREEVVAEKVSVAKRQRAWLGRARCSTGPCAWRPKNIPRRAAFRWILCVDSQIRMVTGVAGLAHFKKPKPGDGAGGDELSTTPLKWPHLSIALDRGSEGCSALHFLQRVAEANIEELWDPSHDSWRDFQRVLRECDMLPFWYMFMVSANLVHGPFLEGSRYKALTEAMSEVAQHFSPDSCPLYDELLRDMLWEAGRAQEVGEEVRQAAWDDLLSEKALLEKQYKITMNRFWHGVQSAWRFAKHWSQFKFAVCYLGLETGALTATNAHKLMFRQNDLDSSTQAKPTSIEEQALKMKINTVALASIFFADYSRLIKLRCLLAVVQPIEEWYRAQAHSLRDIKSNSAWMLSQVGGGYFQHIMEVWKRLAPMAHPFRLGWHGNDFSASAHDRPTCLRPTISAPCL